MNLEVHVPLQLCLFEKTTEILFGSTGCLYALEGNLYFSTLDLMSGYWQIRIAPEDKNKTAFITNDCLYEFNVIQFGLSNSPAIFQRHSLS